MASLNFLLCFSKHFAEVLGILISTIMLSVNAYSFISFFSMYMASFFSYFILIPWISIIRWTRGRKSKYPCLISSLWVKVFYLAPFKYDVKIKVNF